MTAGLRRRRLQPGRLLLYALMSVLAVVFVAPVYLLVITSLKSFDQVSLSRMWDLPRGFSLDSFDRAWNGGEGVIGMRGSFWNSVRMALPATVISCFTGSLNGYVLSKWRFPGSNLLFAAILFGMFIPYQSVLVPLVDVLRGATISCCPFTVHTANGSCLYTCMHICCPYCEWFVFTYMHTYIHTHTHTLMMILCILCMVRTLTQCMHISSSSS